MGDNIIQERSFILDRFLKQVKYDKFLFNSEEMTNFLRPNGDCEKILQLMPKVTTDLILDRY